jgi:alkanesulfonate monooxygenase SsuD/methylene tetrahydromethanopterin reductase-like flavin-dependent oxidoreductase (luciferase family)
MILGTSSLLLSLLNPVDVAEEAANIDILCGGKFILGVSIGYREKEFEAFNILRRYRVGRLTEGVEIIRRLWTQNHVLFKGRHFSLKDISINPKPLQRAGPEIWVGGDTEAGAFRAGEIGDAWMISPRQSMVHIRRLLAKYKEGATKHGKGKGKLLLMRELYVAENKVDAVREAKSFLKQMYDRYMKWGQPGERYDLSFEELARDRYIVGDPTTCIEELRNYIEELGPDHISFRMTWPGMKHENVLNSIRLFGKRILPELKEMADSKQK